METLKSPISLSELCALISKTLDESLASYYWVKAEISSLSERGGHLYLDLVEGKAAKMRATCWAGNKELLMSYFESETGQTLQAGMAVLVEVEIQYHAVYGLSLSIVGIDPGYTLGEIAMQRQRTIAQLQADGLLDAQQLLTLPTLIRRIAVISSPNAAGYEDFCHQLQTTNYQFEISLFPAVMQGEGAAKSILAALEEISNDQRRKTNDYYDVIVIIRGGGATTDLSCFDNYELCAVCAQCELPILTGIGHTRDVSVLDLVAHEALKTPTAVAEWLIHRMDEQSGRVADLLVRLRRTAERQILIRRHRVEMLEQRLAACNPQRFYERGYSLLTKNGKVIRSVHELHKGEEIETHLADGTIQSIVI